MRIWALSMLKELFAALPGMRQLLLEPTFIPDRRGALDLSQFMPCMAEAASIAVQQQLAWQGGHAQGGEEAAGAEVAGAAAGRAACMQCTWQLIADGQSMGLCRR